MSAVLGGQDNDACAAQSAIGAGSFNGVSGFGSFIGGGVYNGINGTSSFIGAGYQNNTAGYYSIVGAGVNNSASADGSFVGGGDNAFYLAQIASTKNEPQFYGNVASGQDSFVGAGDLNQVSGEGSFIGAGGSIYANTNATTAGNRITGTDSFIGAGDQNDVTANEAVISGGLGNKVTGTAGAVGGGQSNLASGAASTIPGGYHNVASGSASFAAGYVAEAIANGTFVWSDESSAAVHVRATAANQFLARASGGFALYSNPALTSGVTLSPGSGTWASLSDRTMKTRIVPLDDATILRKVAALPVSEWSYTSERGVRHVGPMAQDFYAAFGVGEDDLHITSIDEDGVALAAIKALHAENARLHDENAALRARVGAVEAQRASDAAWRANANDRIARLESLLTTRGAPKAR
jgi:hypothetical protein